MEAGAAGYCLDLKILGLDLSCDAAQVRGMLGGKQEMSMAYVTGDVVPNPEEELPFSVVFKRGDEVIAEWLVESVAEGEAQIIEALKGLVEIAEDEGGSSA